jgi:hypothetical protein
VWGDPAVQRGGWSCSAVLLQHWGYTARLVALHARRRTPWSHRRNRGRLTGTSAPGARGRKSRKHDSSSDSSSSSDSEDEGERRRIKAEKAARRVGEELKVRRQLALNRAGES